MIEHLTVIVYQLLATMEHATVATVSATGEPWNTPVYFARQGRSFYWMSRAEAQHSMNIRSNGRAFIVIYDSIHRDASGAALYIAAEVSELTDVNSVAAALDCISYRRGTPRPRPSNFLGASPHRVYEAIARTVWTNVLHEDAIPWDERVEIILDP